MIKDTTELKRRFVSSSYVQLLLEIAERNGIDSDILCRECQVPSPMVIKAGVRLTLQQWSRLILKIIKSENIEGLGYEYGLSSRLTMHGSLGYALMSLPSVGDAIFIISQYLTMRIGHFYKFRLETDPEWAILTLDEIITPSAETQAHSLLLRRFLIEAILTSYITAIRFVLSDDLNNISLNFDWTEPRDYNAYKDRLPDVNFNQQTNYIRFDIHDLKRNFITADYIAYQQAIALCEQERLEFTTSDTNLIDKVRTALILIPYSGYPQLEDVAKHLNYSERTFKRRLKEENLSFRTILNEIRQTEVCDLLENTEMKIQEIAHWIGYSTSSSLIRAFITRYGISPEEFRLQKNESKTVK